MVVEISAWPIAYWTSSMSASFSRAVVASLPTLGIAVSANQRIGPRAGRVAGGRAVVGVAVVASLGAFGFVVPADRRDARPRAIGAGFFRGFAKARSG